jgi:hypothetical protein
MTLRLSIQFGLNEPIEKDVVKMLWLVCETSQPRHSTEEAIDEIKRFAWFSD